MTTGLRDIIPQIALLYGRRICSRLLIRPEKPRRNARRSLCLTLTLAMVFAGFLVQSFAQSPAGAAMPEVEFGARKIFLML